MYDNELETKKIEFKPRIKLNHNIMPLIKNKFRLKCSHLG